MINRTAIIVLHGFESKPPNDLAKALMHSAKIDNNHYVVVTPHLDYRNELDTQSRVDQLVEAYLSFETIDDIVIVGSSFGGFWAHYAAKKYNIKCVLVNPSLQIEHACKHCNIDTENTRHYITLNEEFELNKYRKGVYVEAFVGEKDDVIDPLHAFQEFPVTTLMSNEGHRVKNFEGIIDAVVRASNNLS